MLRIDLCLKGGASTFVSLSTSLLQALVKASAMNDPRIALGKFHSSTQTSVLPNSSPVALDHPLLTAPNKTLQAADMLCMLKAEGQAWWARYKGHAGTSCRLHSPILLTNPHTHLQNAWSGPPSPPPPSYLNSPSLIFATSRTTTKPAHKSSTLTNSATVEKLALSITPCATSKISLPLASQQQWVLSRGHSVCTARKLV